MDDKLQRRNPEPKAADVTRTGTHLAGNQLGPQPKHLPPEDATEIWIEQDDQAKQGMANKVDFKAARAAPGHPHFGPLQSGRQ